MGEGSGKVSKHANVVKRASCWDRRRMSGDGGATKRAVQSCQPTKAGSCEVGVGE